MGSLMHKRCLERILEEKNGLLKRKVAVAVEPSQDSSVTTRVKRIRLRKGKPPSPACAVTTSTTGKRLKSHVSFSEAPCRIILIDGLGSESMKRQRREIWYTREDYKVFWRDRIDSVRMWQMVYGSSAGEDNDSDLEMLLDEQFTVRGLENYTTDQAAAKDLDPKKNYYIQTVLREQQGKHTVEPAVIRELTGNITEESLRRAQKIARQDAVDAQQPKRGRVPRSFSLDASQKCVSPPKSPASVVAFDVARKKGDLRRRVTKHMNKERDAILQQRRCSMQMYEQRQRQLAQQQRQRGYQREMESQHRTIRADSPHHFMYQQTQTPYQSNEAAELAYQQHMNSQSPYGIRNPRRDSMGFCHTNAMPLNQHGPAEMDNGYRRAMASNNSTAIEPRCMTFSPRYRDSATPRRRDSIRLASNDPQEVIQEGIRNAAYSTYIAEFSGMRRDSLAGHYS